MYNEISNIKQSSDQKLIEWGTEAARRDEIKSLDNLMRKIEEQKKQVETHFIQSSNPVPFLDTIEKLASSVNAKNLVSSVDISQDGQFLIVGMNVAGSFESFFKFLTLLENSPYELEFILVDIQRDNIDSKIGGWSAVLKIKLLTFIK
jgi:hypothetical protein